MRETKQADRRSAWFCVACVLAAVGFAQAQTAIETVLHSFGNFPNGANPYSTLMRDASGDLYGTTYQGGAANAGTVFEVEASGSYKVLYSFKGGADGANPDAGVVLDADGNLYGTTYLGGTAGKGVVYKVERSGPETVLYSFTGGNDGSGPYAGVILDKAGNLYGTTYNGGTANAGVVYKLSPSGQETVLHSFTGTADGGNPYAGVILDKAGNLYGTTYRGGTGTGGVVFNQGVVYKLSPSGRETVLYTFGALNNGGGGPNSGVISDAAGNLYGTATNVVYKLAASGQYTVLTTIYAGYGHNTSAGVVIDAAGNLYGTTDVVQAGVESPVPFGVVYKLSATGSLTVLYKFPGPPKLGRSASAGINPGVILDAAGNLYGATPNAGRAGMVYELDAANQETTLYSFPAAPGGSGPFGGVILDSAGNLYGTAVGGGPADAGVLYKMDAAGQETVLHSFTDGVGKGVARDSAGNLYGTASDSATGFGVVYKLTPSGVYTVLYRFTGGADGTGSDGVIVDPAGNLYGAGGGGTAPAGLVFKLDSAGRFTVLYTFTGGTDGNLPNTGLILDSAGNLYGTTASGGTALVGVIFRIDPSGQETVLYSFTGADGGAPLAGVIADPAGNLYGTADTVVFELSAEGNYTVLHRFTGDFSPVLGVVRDKTGNLYGTTEYGGGTGCGGLGCGVVYEVSSSGQETVLHSFTGGADGDRPESGVILDSADNLYGTCPEGGAAGAGVLYQLVLD